MGNSKTVMVAALSPADLNYEETMSTLRFGEPHTRAVEPRTIVVDSKEMVHLQKNVSIINLKHFI